MPSCDLTPGVHFPEFLREGRRAKVSLRDRIWNSVGDCANRRQHRKIPHNKKCCAGFSPFKFFQRHTWFLHECFLNFRKRPQFLFIYLFLRNFTKLIRHQQKKILNFLKWQWKISWISITEFCQTVAEENPEFSQTIAQKIVNFAVGCGKKRK